MNALPDRGYVEYVRTSARSWSARQAYALATAKAIAVAVVLAVLTHMSWNLFAPDLLGLPEVRMKQTLGLAVFGGILTFMLRHGVAEQMRAAGLADIRTEALKELSPKAICVIGSRHGADEQGSPRDFRFDRRGPTPISR